MNSSDSMSDEEVVAFSRDQRMPKEGEPVCVVPPYRMIESRFVVNMESTYATKRKKTCAAWSASEFI